MKALTDTGLAKVAQIIKGNFIPNSLKGVANGVAPLNAEGKIPPELMPELVDLLSYGIKWELGQSSPTCIRIGNPTLHSTLPIQSRLRGCVAQGNNIQYYLNENNWAFKEDGVTPSRLDGYDGNVMVDTGDSFFGKSGKEGNYYWVRISEYKIDDSWVEIPRILISAYKLTVLNTVPADMGYLSSLPINSALSVCNTNSYCRGGNNATTWDSYLSTDPVRSLLGKPRSSIPRATMRGYATNGQMELLNYEWYKWLCWLFYIEYATFNSQLALDNTLTAEGYKKGGLGAGVSDRGTTTWQNLWGGSYYALVPCGAGNALGNFTTTDSHPSGITISNLAYPDENIDAKTSTIARYRGIEEIFGSNWTNLDGIIVKCYNDELGTYHRAYYSTTDSSKYGDTEAAAADMNFVGDEVQANGYVGEFNLRDKAEMVPATVGGGSTTKKCDYHYQDSPNTGLKTLLVGGHAGHGALAGLACFYSNFGVGYSYTYVGFRGVVRY